MKNEKIVIALTTVMWFAIVTLGVYLRVTGKLW